MEQFPISLKLISTSIGNKCTDLADTLMASYEKNAVVSDNHYKKDDRTLRIQSFQRRQSKGEIDAIDVAISKLLKLTPSQLDFIINFDVKYRMGSEDNSDED